MKRPGAPLSDAAVLREKLSQTRGPAYWRSLEELTHTAEFQAELAREFPAHASELNNVDRRTFLALMGASLGLAGLTGCGQTQFEKIVPYVRAPEEIVSGMSSFFATATTLSGYARGVLVRSYMGRPIKIEGNPQHPSSLGGTDSFMQAEILNLYDPDRSQSVMNFENVSTWERFLIELNEKMTSLRAKGGAGLRILTERVTSPTLAVQLKRVQELLPDAHCHQYESVGRSAAREGAVRAFGRAVDTLYRFDQADVIVTLDADFLSESPHSARYSRDFTSRRRVRRDQPEMNRLYAVESSMTLSGAMADHRLAVMPSLITQFARELARSIGVQNLQSSTMPMPSRATKWLTPLSRELMAHRGRSLIVAGDSQPPSVHALAHAMNETLGNVGNTVIHIEEVAAQPVDHFQSLRELTDAMHQGQVELLLICGANPVHSAPGDVDFAAALRNVRLSARLGLYADETSHYCHWHIPMAHELESWGDARAVDGTATILQPVTLPLYGGRSPYELLALLLNDTKSPLELIRDHWRRSGKMPDFEADWKRALHDGVVADTTSTAVSVTVVANYDHLEPTRSEGLEIVIRPDPTVWDGRFANNAWQQELPKPLSKLTWENAVFISPATAAARGLANGDVVLLTLQGRSVSAPVWVSPGHADQTVTVHLGYGRTMAGRVGGGLGFNVSALRTLAMPYGAPGALLQKTAAKRTLACTQGHHSMEGRDIVRMGSLQDFLRPHPPHEARHASLYLEHVYDSYAWGMVIDQTVCTGCSACVTACMAENNIPVVGKDQVLRGREMHWLRIDRYYTGDVADPDVAFQPMLCQHCEKAPCEYPCPVAATTHSSEGLNEMTYNRCIGTRYCANNCPYKVRRFNFLDYAPDDPARRVMQNPDVTVRERGVMEKCTYCVQRINDARIDAKKENRRIRDGEVVTACQAACPAEAIIFGDINDPNSRVAKLKAQPHNYGVLAELNTQPRTTYLSRLRNPNPEIESLEARRGL
jgi:MoCo/4Fe-4S cofactor protein with predicted Tat translocation signal